MLYFPCGIIRGALANLGITSIVSANLGSHPACNFSIQIKSS
jgi:trafficking protein particle complex subunit 6